MPFMIIRLVSHGDLFLFDSSPQLAVHKRNPAGCRRDLLLKNAAHVMEKLGSAGEERGRVVHVVKEILSVLVSLLRSQCEPLDSGGPILRNIFPEQIQLAKGILCELIPSFCGLRQPMDRTRCILGHSFTVQ